MLEDQDYKVLHSDIGTGDKADVHLVETEEAFEVRIIKRFLTYTDARNYFDLFGGTAKSPSSKAEAEDKGNANPKITP